MTAEEALAESWASIDGKLSAFQREQARSRVAPLDREEEGYTGHYEGYIAEAEEMIVRLKKRGYVIIPVTPSGETIDALLATLLKELGRSHDKGARAAYAAIVGGEG